MGTLELLHEELNRTPFRLPLLVAPLHVIGDFYGQIGDDDNATIYHWFADAQRKPQKCTGYASSGVQPVYRWCLNRSLKHFNAQLLRDVWYSADMPEPCIWALHGIRQPSVSAAYLYAAEQLRPALGAIRKQKLPKRGGTISERKRANRLRKN